MFNGIKMESIHFILQEIEENKAVVALKSDLNDGRDTSNKCAVILCIRGSSYRDKEILYEDTLRIYEKHLMRRQKSLEKGKN